MSELTDLQICKRIAEIENKGDCFNWFDTFAIRTEMYSEREEYNPLTDDALCFQLMVKYNLSLIAPEREQEDWDCVILDVLTVNESPNRAICLAIIEAYKVKS
jgi:hypothetical protein